MSTSGTLRQTIPGCKRALITRLKDAEQSLSTRIPEELEDKKDLLEDLKVAQQMIQSSITKISSLDQQWIQIISSLDEDTAITAEHAAYEKTATNETDGYHRLLEQAESVHVRVSTRVDRLEQSVQITSPVTLTGQYAPVSAQVNSSHHLPEMTLPTFDGDILKFQDFWSIFNATVHNRTDLSQVEKLAYLLPQLEGTAAQAVQGYHRTDANYALIVRRLKERFERSDDRFVSMLHGELKRIPSCGTTTEDKRNTLDSCERVFRQLEECGETLDPGKSLVFDLLAKFSSGMIRRLDNHYKVGVYSKLSEVRTTLEKSITQDELTTGFLQDLSLINQHDQSKGTKKKSIQDSNKARQESEGSVSPKHTESTFVANAGRFKQFKPKGPLTTPPGACYFCEDQHFNDKCGAYTTAKARIQRLRQLGRCTRCMNFHGNEKCHAKIYCHLCKVENSHRTSLCYTKYPEKAGSENQLKSKSGQKREATNLANEAATGKPTQHEGNLAATEVANFTNSCTKNSLFQTAKVRAKNLVTGEEAKVRICLDTLSNRTYITEKAAQLLNLHSEGQDKLHVSVFGSTKSIDVISQIVSLGLLQNDGKVLQIEANTTKIISNSAILPQEWPRSEEHVIQSLKSCLADDPFDQNKSIDILIGADYTWDILQGPKATVTSSDIFLIPSVFGFMLGGQLHYKLEDNAMPTMFCFTQSASRYPSELGLITVESKHQAAYPDIDEFWNLESIGITDSPHEDDDLLAIQNFKDTVQYHDGRYHVKWPWISGKKENLPTNYRSALNRFRSLTTRLQSDHNLLEGYRTTIRQQIEKGIIEKVPPDEISSSGTTHYLPHHPVIKKSSATTKLRIVYDASATQHKDDLSLNECLHRGPVILPNLCQLLIRFRLSSTVVISDVEKAFLQVGIQKEDRDATRFLWFEDDAHPSTDRDNLAVLRFARVAFGIISSPFLLGITIVHHLEGEGTTFAQNLVSDIYVDNIISGIPDDQSPMDYYHKVKALFSRAGMNVQEFCSNSKQMMLAIPEQDRMKECDTKVLGVKWDSQNDDTLRIARSSKFTPTTVLTKRTALQNVAAVFDPLGFFQPATFPAKLFLQKLWFHGKSWDAPLSHEMVEEWTTLSKSLESLFHIRIPRYIGKLNTSSSIVAFSDASGKGYGAAIYLRTKQENEWTTHLIFAKSRLAPSSTNKKKASSVSIPRLELLGVTVAIAAVSFCREAVHDSNLPVTVFTDSECVLHWLRGTRPLKRFVERRIEKMRAMSNCSYRFVSTDDNPADLLTRGTDSSDLMTNTLWWHGPQWLSDPEIAWPETRLLPIQGEACKEFKPTPVPVTHTLAATEQTEPVSVMGVKAESRSNLTSLLRITWLQLKFLKLHVWNKLTAARQLELPHVASIFEPVSVQQFTTNDYQHTLKMWVRAVQESVYHNEITALRGHKKLPLISQLNLRIDDDGLLRTCSRYQHADLPESSRYPVLLPKNHTFSALVIQDTHSRLKHSGATHTLSELRRTFWIPHGRAYVMRVIRKCSLCRRFKFTHEFKLPPMPPWPAERVSRSAPFQYVGLDYFGPMKVKVGEDTQKMWACIFTCLSTRAIHLEPVMDCSASEFFHCLKRFIARRGCPQQVISDNAAQFQLVKILSDKAWTQNPQDDTILTYSAQQNIRWQFIVALAPWQGGHYERLVGVVKSVLKTTVGRRLLSWTDLITLLTETEAIVNSRPITYVNSEVDSMFRILRPVDFLLYRPITSPPLSHTDFTVRDLGEGGKHLAALWKSREKYLQKLWALWYDEYLLNLRERSNPFHRGGRARIDRVPVEGEVVIIRDDDLPRGSWKLARVIKFFTSKDSKIRSADIEFANGQKVRRTVNFLIPLEAGEDTSTPAQAGSSEAAAEQVGSGDASELDDDGFLGFSSQDVQRARHLLQLCGDDEHSQSQ